MLSIKDECTSLFSDFVIIGLCNSSANSRVAKSKGRCFEMLSFLIPLPDVFYKKKL